MSPGRRVLAAAVSIGAVGSTLSLSSPAVADRVFLAGGGVIEGEASRKDGKVIIEMDSGEVAIPETDVVRIEDGESALSQFEARHAALRPGDVRGRLLLADYCRDHDLGASEKRVLHEILDIDPDNAAARARLGYVRSGSGWITQADAFRARGLVEHDGQWMRPEDVREARRLREEAEVAARRKEAADAELAAKRAELSAQQAALEAAEARARESATYEPYYGAPYYYGALPFAPSARRPRRDFDACKDGHACSPSTRRTPRPPKSFGTPDARSLDVVKVPYRNP